MSSNKAVNMLHNFFDGRDPLAEAHAVMLKMDHETLANLVLIATNRIGLLMKGSDYEDPLDAPLHLCQGVDMIFSAYSEALVHLGSAKAEAGDA